jgi:DNA-binding transcriptional LysR family regulator
MELRLLRYFLTVAKEQSFTKAAEQLHITQPTLSRQMAAFEEDLGITLFIRSGKKISLTDEGILLKRRALEILNLEERTIEELKGKEEVVEGTITIGCGEFAAVETLAKICKTYKEKYPLVQIVLHTATADAVYEMMNKGLVDIALFMEPMDTEGLDYIRITDCDHWCVGMRPDDPLAEKEFIKKEDLVIRTHIHLFFHNRRSIFFITHFHTASGFFIHPVKIKLCIWNFRLNLKQIRFYFLCDHLCYFFVVPLALKNATNFLLIIKSPFLCVFFTKNRCIRFTFILHIYFKLYHFIMSNAYIEFCFMPGKH